HHVSELAGELKPAAAWRPRRLDEQDVAANRRPGEARRHTRPARAHRHLVLEAHLPEDPLDLLDADQLLAGGTLGELDRDMPQHAADLALETAHAGLARVA